MARSGVEAKRVLTIDIGGNNVKVLVTGETERRKFPSGEDLTPEAMVEGVKTAVEGWEFDVVSMGIPSPVVNGKILHDPVNLGPGWVDFDFEAAFGKPVKIINDAAMQALGSYKGGTMLFLGLGTGLGSTMIINGVLAPMELGHLPYKKASFETYVGTGGMEEYGKKKWREMTLDVIERLRNALVADYVVVGGGNVRELTDLPDYCREGDNLLAFRGGELLWEEPVKE